MPKPPPNAAQKPKKTYVTTWRDSPHNCMPPFSLDHYDDINRYNSPAVPTYSPGELLSVIDTWSSAPWLMREHLRLGHPTPEHLFGLAPVLQDAIYRLLLERGFTVEQAGAFDDGAKLCHVYILVATYDRTYEVPVGKGHWHNYLAVREYELGPPTTEGVFPPEHIDSVKRGLNVAYALRVKLEQEDKASKVTRAGASVEGEEAGRNQKAWLAEAMVLVESSPNLSNAEIARQVNVSGSTLSRSRAYKTAAGLARAQGTRPKLGYRDRDRGGKATTYHTEAVDDAHVDDDA